MSKSNGESEKINAKKTEVSYYLDLMYIAPQNAVDEKGKPVLQYSRTLVLDKGTFDIVNDQLRNGLVNIFIPQKIKLSTGQMINSYTYVNLNNTSLIKANTAYQEFYTEEGIQDQEIQGKTVLYTADNKPIVRQ